MTVVSGATQNWARLPVLSVLCRAYSCTSTRSRLLKEQHAAVMAVFKQIASSTTVGYHQRSMHELACADCRRPMCLLAFLRFCWLICTSAPTHNYTLSQLSLLHSWSEIFSIVAATCHGCGDSKLQFQSDSAVDSRSLKAAVFSLHA